MTSGTCFSLTYLRQPTANRWRYSRKSLCSVGKRVRNLPRDTIGHYSWCLRSSKSSFSVRCTLHPPGKLGSRRGQGRPRPQGEIPEGALHLEYPHVKYSKVIQLLASPPCFPSPAAPTSSFWLAQLNVLQTFGYVGDSTTPKVCMEHLRVDINLMHREVCKVVHPAFVGSPRTRHHTTSPGCSCFPTAIVGVFEFPA